MADNSQVNNIVLKCHYYKSNNTNEEYAKHRDFVSCNGSYNYLSYIHTGSTEQVPKDYEEYVGSKEKSCGVFNQNGLLSDKQIKELKQSLQTTQSVIWDMVISFREEFGNNYCRDYDQAYEFMKSEMPRFLKKAGLNPDNIVWYAGLHENTENKHIHVSFFEKEPLYYANGNNLKFHSGKIAKNVLIDSKFMFEKKLTNATAQLIKNRKNLLDSYNVEMTKTQIARKGKKLLIELYTLLPSEGRISYDSENMRPLKLKVDEVTKYFIGKNKQISKAYFDFASDVMDFKLWKKTREYLEGDNLMKDIMRRLGNKTIQVAIKVGKKHDEIERLNLKTSNYKAIKKRYRKNILDELLDLMENNAKAIQDEMDFFERYHNKLEYYRKQIEYENSHSKSRYSDYEM